MKFPHLHARSVYDPMRGMLRIATLGEGVVACATDRNLWAQVKLAKVSVRNAPHLVHGAEFELRSGEESLGHVVLLAKSGAGWRGLRRLASLATPARVALSDLRELTAAERGGLVLLTGGTARGPVGVPGALHAALLRGGRLAAEDTLASLLDAAPELEVCVELAPTMGADWRDLWAVASLQGVSVVATADAYYEARSDGAAWQALRAVAEKRRISAVEASEWGHLATREELSAFFADCPVAIQRAEELAQACARGCVGVLVLGEVALPDFVGDDGRPMGQEEQVAELHAVAWAGLEARLRAGVRGGEAEVYRGRLSSELAMIERLGFQGYFLAYWEFCDWARREGIPLGPGRGSAAGSLVVWCLGITELDPVEHGLYVERFINPERVSWPDIDTDVCKLGRGRVIAHLKDKYGEGSVGRILSFKALQGKTAIKDVGRALGLSYFRLNALLAGTPNLVGGKAPTVAWLSGASAVQDCDRTGLSPAESALLTAMGTAKYGPACAAARVQPDEFRARMMRQGSAAWNVPSLRDACEADRSIAACVALASAVEGCVRESGVHASGVVVSRGALVDWVPTCAAGKNGARELCSQWSMEDAEEAGLVKLDILGLSTVTHIDQAVRLVNEERQRGEPDPDSRGGGGQGRGGGSAAGSAAVRPDQPGSGVGSGTRPPTTVALTLADIPLDDAPTYELMARADTLGVFQMGKVGLRRTLRRVKPTRFGDISATVALHRPGPLLSGMTRDYIARKHGKQPIESLHHGVDAVCAETYGTVVYQEQVMAAVRAVAGYSLGQADVVRKIMGKKKPEMLAKERVKFLAAARSAATCDEATALRVWGVVEAASGYSFNKSHSVAYAYLAYYTAWLKRHHPVEFYAAWMTTLASESEAHKRLAEAVYDARAHGVEVLPPCAARSAADFLPETLPDGRRAVRYGLAGLRGLGKKCIASLLEARPVTMADFLRRVRATKRDLAALVGSGACDELLAADGADRAQALRDTAALVRWAQAQAKAAKPAARTARTRTKPATKQLDLEW